MPFHVPNKTKFDIQNTDAMARTPNQKIFFINNYPENKNKK